MATWVKIRFTTVKMSNMSGKKIMGGHILLLLITCSILTVSCRKNDEEYSNPAVVQLLNAMDDDIQLLVNYSGKHPVRYSTSLELWNKSYNQFSAITIHELPQTLALYSKEDTLEKDMPLIKASLDLVQGASYSLLAFGSKTAPDYILHKDEHTPGNISDSLTFIRVINLVKGQKISVNLKGDPAGSAEQNIDFRQVTAFKGYNADRSVVEHVFEFRDQATGSLILSFPITDINETNISKNTWLNRTNSLVLTGHMNGTGVNEPKVVRIPHFF